MDVTQCDDGSACRGSGSKGSICCGQRERVSIVDWKETRTKPNKTGASPSATIVTKIVTSSSTTPTTIKDGAAYCYGAGVYIYLKTETSI